MATFVDRALVQLAFLEKEYGFAIVQTDASTRLPETEGFVRYISATTFVKVYGDPGGAVGTVLGRASDSEKFAIGILTLAEYSLLSAAEKRLVLSRDAKDDRRARELMSARSLQKTQEWRLIRELNYAERSERGIADNAKWLLQYADPLLRGDFSSWRALFEYKVERQVAERIRSGSADSELRFTEREAGRVQQEVQPLLAELQQYLVNLKAES